MPAAGAVDAVGPGAIAEVIGHERASQPTSPSPAATSPSSLEPPAQASLRGGRHERSRANA
jgi:hypothetical protein